MFCDLVGSTGLSEQLDPEDLGRIIRRFQICCTEVASQYGGHVARYMGDGLLVYFGYPVAHENAAERALHAGLRIIESVRRLPRVVGRQLQVRVGVATGPVVAGETIGSGTSQEQVVMGETPNLAFRLQSAARPDSLHPLTAQ
jgi:class 3 adenylate cyclase